MKSVPILPPLKVFGIPIFITPKCQHKTDRENMYMSKIFWDWILNIFEQQSLSKCRDQILCSLETKYWNPTCHTQVVSACSFLNSTQPPLPFQALSNRAFKNEENKTLHSLETKIQILSSSAGSRLFFFLIPPFQPPPSPPSMSQSLSNRAFQNANSKILRSLETKDLNLTCHHHLARVCSSFWILSPTSRFPLQDAVSPPPSLHVPIPPGQFCPEKEK